MTGNFPTATPTGVEPTHDAFLCPFDCTMGWITVRLGLTRFRPIRCDCDSCDPNAPAGYVSEVQCWDCDETVTPETTRGLDGPSHVLCAKCFDEWTDPLERALAACDYDVLPLAAREGTG